MDCTFQPTAGNETAYSWQDYSPLMVEKQPTGGFSYVANSLIIRELYPVFAYK